MNLKFVHDFTFYIREKITAATFSKSNEIVILFESGEVTRFNLDNQREEQLFSVKSIDKNFDLTARTSIYTLDEIVVIVNDYKCRGIIHYPGKYHALNLYRTDYHADISTYPVALYKNKAGVPHIIFGQAWNHVQVMNLDTRQILTATKSLIETDAEKRYTGTDNNFDSFNKSGWPSPFDYFYGRLYLSPDQDKFLSAGWCWGSWDVYNVFDIETFISSNRISYIGIGGWEHDNRPVCWVDNETIAVGYDPFKENYGNAAKEAPYEIHFLRVGNINAETIRTIQVADRAIKWSGMFYDQTLNSIIMLSETAGLLVITQDGQIVLKDEMLKSNGIGYNYHNGFLIKTLNNRIIVYKITI